MAKDTTEIPGGVVFVELVRLAIVILGVGLALELAGNAELSDTGRLVLTALGAGGGYVVGGVLGRFAQTRISRTERRMQEVSTSEIVAGAGGGLLGLVLGAAVAWPALLFGGKAYTVPIAAIVVTTTGWTGWRLGRSRASDLLRYLRVGGRLPSGSRAAGSAYKLVDTSALIDGRLVEVCRGGWIDGVLLVPTFVLYELQGLADAADPERRRRGQRGLDNLASLQQLSSVGVEVLEEHAPGDEVDVQLLGVARERGTPLITTDANLARVAEVQGLKVRNLHALADSLRPPVLPGDELEVRIAKEGRERHQGVGYLPDGTMVVIERAEDAIGQSLIVEVTSIMANANGRMLFATRTDRPRSVAARDPSA